MASQKNIREISVLTSIWVIYIFLTVFDNRLNLIRPELMRELGLLAGLIVLFTVIISRYIFANHSELCYITSIFYSGLVIYWRSVYFGKPFIFLLLLVLIPIFCYFIYSLLCLKYRGKKSLSWLEGIGISIRTGIGVVGLAILTIFFHFIHL